MNQLVKIGIVFVLLIVGIAAALAFRKTPDDNTAVGQRQDATDQPTSTPGAGAASKSPATAADQAGTAGVVAPVPVNPLQDQFQEPEPSKLAVPPPPMSASYPDTTQPSLVPLPRVARPAATSLPAPAAAMVDVKDRDQPVARTRNHTVRDGDTLADLAHRFLGDSRRGQEIFDANRNLLDDPDILPIGATLSILIPQPTKATAPPANGILSASDAASPQDREVIAAGPLVPVAPAQ